MRKTFVAFALFLVGLGCAETQHVVRISPTSFPEFERELGRVEEPEVRVPTVFLKDLLRKQKKQEIQNRELASKLRAIRNLDQEGGRILR